VGRRVLARGATSDVLGFEAAAAAGGLRVVSRLPRKRAQQGDVTTVRLVGSSGGPATGDVLVALDRPYVLGAGRSPVRLATYGSTPGAMRALVDVLLGRATAPGELPVPVAGAARSGC
jgi:beta-N-acetylhexosaminidase